MSFPCINAFRSERVPVHAEPPATFRAGLPDGGSAVLPISDFPATPQARRQAYERNNSEWKCIMHWPC